LKDVNKRIVKYIKAKNKEIENINLAYHLVSVRIHLEKIKAEFKFSNPNLYFATSDMLGRLDELEKLYRRKKD